MKPLIAVLTLSVLLLSPSFVLAQTRSRRTTTPRRTSTSQQRRNATAAASSRLDSTQTNAARLKLGDQIKNLTRFVYLYGRFSKDLELTGAQQGEASDVAQRTRSALQQNLRNIREGLDQLEGQFRLTPGLDRHYAQLRGVAQRATEAENMVNSNRLDQAGRTMVEIVNQLTNVLLDM